MHQCVTHFIREQAGPEIPGALVEAHFEAFVSAAQRFKEHPGDAQASALFLSYPAALEFWTALLPEEAALSLHAHEVGEGIVEGGRYDEALPWFERAVEIKQKGDVHGRVDHESLGRSLHQVGDCHGSVGRYDEALGWFERAVEAKQKGNIHGRVNHDSLRISLDAVHRCRSLVTAARGAGASDPGSGV